MPLGTGTRVPCFGTPESWKVEEIAQGRKKTTADPGTRPRQLTILYTPLTELHSTALVPKRALGWVTLPRCHPWAQAAWRLLHPLWYGSSSTCPALLSVLVWEGGGFGGTGQLFTSFKLSCLKGGLLLRREQEVTDTVLLSLQGLLMVKKFLLHLCLHKRICRTARSVLDFFLYLKNLRPKVRQRPSAAEQYAQGKFFSAHISFIQTVHSELDHSGYA